MSNLDYEVHADLNLIEVRPSGEVQISDIAAYGMEALRLDLVSDGTIEYYDLSEMTSLNADDESARELSWLLRAWISRGWAGSLFFTPQESLAEKIEMIGGIAERIEDASAAMMMTRRQPTSLREVRDIITARRLTSLLLPDSDLTR